jgi:DNA processing protein
MICLSTKRYCRGSKIFTRVTINQNMHEELQQQIALTFIPQVGSVTAKLLVSYCGGAAEVFKASKQDLLKIPGIGPLIAENIRSSKPLLQAEKELEFMNQHGIEAVFYSEEKFPVRLKQLPDAPTILYFKGSSLDLFNKNRVLAIVGTRKPTDYGKQCCEEFVEGMQPYAPLIVSGLAYGIDVTAHKKAVAMGIPNIGVLGHGLGMLYPEEHRSVAMKMIENGGILSEFPHKTPPDRENFPMRNRIIAGLCDALLVVETIASGGSMISAKIGTQYGRDIFAIPGRTRDLMSAGCNLLIKTDKARLVESADDLAQYLNWEKSGQQKSIQKSLFLDLSDTETLVVDTIKENAEIPIDQLTFKTGLKPGELASLLLKLEFQGVLRTLPGKRYILVA